MKYIFHFSRNLLTNMDQLMFIGPKNVTSSPAILWETAFACGKIDDSNTTMSKEECRAIYWSAVKYTVRYIAEAGQQLVNDLTEYFSEISGIFFILSCVFSFRCCVVSINSGVINIIMFALF